MVLRVQIQVTSENPDLKAAVRNGKEELTLVAGLKFETLVLRDKPLRIADSRGDWRDSLIDELNDIELRLKSLVQYVNSPTFVELPLEVRALLNMQIYTYRNLSLIITERLK